MSVVGKTKKRKLLEALKNLKINSVYLKCSYLIIGGRYDVNLNEHNILQSIHVKRFSSFIQLPYRDKLVLQRFSNQFPCIQFPQR